MPRPSEFRSDWNRTECPVPQSEDCLSESGYPEPVPGQAPEGELFLIPSVIFNDDGVTLDDMTVQDIENAAGAAVCVVSCNPLDYLPEIIALAERENVS